MGEGLVFGVGGVGEEARHCCRASVRVRVEYRGWGGGLGLLSPSMERIDMKYLQYLTDLRPWIGVRRDFEVKGLGVFLAESLSGTTSVKSSANEVA